MSKQTPDSFLIVNSSVTAFCKSALEGILGYDCLGKRLVEKIKSAHAFRRFDIVGELARILLNLPINEYRIIGQYYVALCSYWKSEADPIIFESIAEQSQTYKPRALMTLAGMEGVKQNTPTELFYFNEALKTSPNISDFIEISKAIAVIKAKEGFHNQALKDFEKVLPLFKYANPFAQADFLNSYAVELGEAGRKEEARNVSKIVLASPFAAAYPEWQDTARELREPNRAFISIPHIEYTPIEVEPREDHRASEPKQPASVIAFKLKEAPLPDKPEKVTAQELDAMTASQKRELILTALRSGEIRESEYSKLIFMLGLFEYGPSANILDLEDETVLDDLIVIWANLIEPEQLAAVLSALRDCDSDLRRTNLIDRMIRRAFEESRTCGITEEEWRLKVECKLPKK